MNRDIPTSVIWTDQLYEDTKSDREITSLNVFVMAMLVMRSPVKENFTDGSSYYNNGSIFEIGCYLILRIDKFLLQKYPKYRDIVSNELVTDFVSFFEKVFDGLDVGSVFNSRIQHYSNLMGKTSDPSDFHKHIDRMIVLNAQEGYPQPWAPGMPIVFGDAMISFELYIRLANWDAHTIPAVLSSVEKYIHAIK